MSVPFMITMPAASLRHLTIDTQCWLHQQLEPENDCNPPQPPFTYAAYEDGVFLRVPACTARADSEQRAEFYSFPPDLQALFLYMSDRAPFAWFMLDVDGDPIPNFPLYED